MKITNSLYSPSIPAPSNPQNLTVVNVNSTAITVSWQSPKMPNGVITAYNVWYNQTLNCSGSLVSFSGSVAGSVLMYTFTGLEEDTVYVFYVSAETSAGEGEAAMVMGRTSEDGKCVGGGGGVYLCVCVGMHWCGCGCGVCKAHQLSVAIAVTIHTYIKVISPCSFLYSESYFHLPFSLPTSSSIGCSRVQCHSCYCH